MEQTSERYNAQHQAFINYLMERFDGDWDEVARVVETAERIIPNTLHDYFGTPIQSIYELTDMNEVKEYCRKIKIEPILKSLDMDADPRYTDVLKWYRLWLKSRHTGGEPYQVPGEAEQPTSAHEDKPHHTEQTIYLEGEAAQSLPKEVCLRNQKLREACIAYYKAKHHGHLICECCGFDFAAHYALDNDDDYIEIHHRTPFSQTEGAHEVDAETDLVPLCANCHRMIHHLAKGQGSCITVDELKNRLK